MKIYLAGIATQPELARYGGRYLESYLYFRDKKESISSILNKWEVKDLMLDSGAFSAFTRGVDIDIEEYGRAILESEDSITKYANLDVIGDEEETYKNWLILKEMGCNPMPVIHYGADKKWFDIYLREHKVDYIALGGLVPYAKRRTKLKNWLDYSFSLIQKYYPVKVHLFGITTNWVLKRYPIYSCDSTSWLHASITGQILVFNGSNVVVHRNTRVYSRVYGYRENNTRSALAYMEYEKYLTKLWEKKGVVWN